jgi:SAM-dependent methyltransferase
MEQKKAWFETWFDSPYYHILYDHRDEDEAEHFILHLNELLRLGAGDRVLDLGCGAGRHAALLAKYAGEAIGIDLSANSISAAQEKYALPNLEFYTHDMRQPFRINYFTHIFNFFTSFGYFGSLNDNIRVLDSARKGLRPGGCLLIDFMNAARVLSDLGEREEVKKQGIPFYIRREVSDGKILKHIKFDAENKVYSFTESVQAFTRDDFHRMLKQTGFGILEEFGDYALGRFDVNLSSRYIVLARKN